MKIQILIPDLTKPKTKNMKSIIQFASPQEMTTASRLFRIAKPRNKPTYNDLILRPEYQSRKFVFSRGQTCIRILPQLAGSKSWMHGIQLLTHPNGQHVDPKSLQPRGKSVFATAYSWLRANKPDLLFSKNNRDGFRLLPSPMAICWLLVEIDGKMEAKLFYGSAYDGGTAGGNCGVVHQLFKAASERDEQSGHDATHAEHGVQIIIEKSIPLGSKYPNYKMTRNSMEAPINRYLERMDESEINAICPLHDVLRRVEPEEEWELLAKVIGEELRDEIRNSTTKTLPTSVPKPEPSSLADDNSAVAIESPPMTDIPMDSADDDEWPY